MADLTQRDLVKRCDHLDIGLLNNSRNGVSGSVRARSSEWIHVSTTLPLLQHNMETKEALRPREE
jgi:hypothetical protein